MLFVACVGMDVDGIGLAAESRARRGGQRRARVRARITMSAAASAATFALVVDKREASVSVNVAAGTAELIARPAITEGSAAGAACAGNCVRPMARMAAGTATPRRARRARSF